MNVIIRPLIILITLVLLLHLPHDHCAAIKYGYPPAHNPRSIAGPGYIDINWDAITNTYYTGLIGYRVYKRTAGTSYDPTHYFSTTETSYRDTQVSYGNTYFYAIKGVFKYGIGSAQPPPYESDNIVETGETYVDTRIKTYTDVVAKKPAPFSSPPAVAVVGDLNEDGKKDLILGFPQEDKVRIYLDCNTNTLPSITLQGVAWGERFGDSIAVADLNRDGAGDLIIGAPYASAGTTSDKINKAGRVYVYLGARRFRLGPALILQGKAAYDANGIRYPSGEALGTSLAAVGDVTWDGFPDVAIGAPGGGTARSGRILVLKGGPIMTNRTEELLGPVPMTFLGQSIAAAGDVNGDGRADILVGGADCEGTAVTAGQARLIYGGKPLRWSNVVLSGPNCYGSLVAGLNINGDRYADIAVGSKKSPYATDVYYGGPSISTRPNISFPTGGGILSSLGDLNGDRSADLLVDNLTVHYGNGTGENIPDILRADDGGTVIGTGDVDGDGRSEVLTYASGYVYANSLASYVALPNITVVSPQNDASITHNRCPTIDGSITGSISRVIVAGVASTLSTDGHFSRRTNLFDGPNTIEIIAETPAGAVSKRIFNFILDPPPPLNVEITSPVSGELVYPNQLTVTGTVSDPSARVTVNGVDVVVSNGFFETTVNLSPRQSSVTAVATDQYCQTNWCSVAVELITPVPTVNMVAEPAKIHPGEEVVLYWFSTDATSCSISPGVIFVPWAGFVSVYPMQTTTYVITASNSGGSATASAEVIVINQAPVAANDAATTDQDTPAIVKVLANDTDPDGDLLSVASTTQGTHGVVAVNPDNTVTYTPALNFRGEDRFTYTAVDGHGGTATAQVAVTVLAVNHPPAAANDSGEVEQGEGISINVLANDRDPDGDALQIAAFTQPAHGTVTTAGNGTLRYIATAGFSGQDTFTYTVRDPGGATSTASVKITIKGPISLHISSPQPGELIQGRKVLVEGTVVNKTGLETGVTINGEPALIYGDHFVANHVPLDEGINTLLANATDTAGNVATDTVLMDSDQSGGYVEITPDAASGIPPLEANLYFAGTLSFNQSGFSFTGPGTVDYSSTTPEAWKVRMLTPGIYYFTLVATDNEHSDRVAIVVSDRDELDRLLKAKWNGMKSALISGNPGSALEYFLESTRDRYSEVFNAISSTLPAIAADMREIQLVYARDRVVKYRIKRQEQVQGQVYDITYYIYFVKNPFGMWCIQSF